jgi:hypothetical protein
MSKNNKVNRTEKKRQKAKELRKLAAQQTHKTDNKSNLSSPVFTEMNNPFEHLTEEQRKNLINEIGESSKNTFYESLSNLQLTLKSYNPITLLAIITGYALNVGAGDNGVQSKENSGALTQSHVEILQALLLQTPSHNWGEKEITPDIIQSVWDTLIEMSQYFHFMRMKGGILEATEKDKSVNAVQEWIRNNTQFVRNWGYYLQVLTISTELYSYFDEMLLDKVGFSATEVITIFNFMLRSTEQSLTERYTDLKKLRAIKKPKELIFSYCELVGQSLEEAEYFCEIAKNKKMSIDNLFFMMLSRYDLSMSDCFYFTAESISEDCGIDLANTKLVLNYFSYSAGDLQDKNTESLFFDNPIWHKPIIKGDEDYFCPMPQLFFSFIIPSLDEIIEKIDKEKLHDRRANYLEEKIEEIVKRRFPEALTVSCVKWRLNKEQFETDLITFIDSHAIIIEAKACKISKEALRGAPDRIKRHVKEIFIKPSIQSKRLEDRLNELRLDSTINDELRDKLPVNLNAIHKVLRVSVSLEDFASLQANFNRFNDTEWLPEDFYPCPTMNLADFETLFDYLEHPVQIIHYLDRRTELEGRINFIGCELNFMGLYAKTLFNFGNMQLKDNTEITLLNMSAALDNYYSSKSEGIIIKKPKPKISKLFEDIFLRLEGRSLPQWTEIGVLLNRFSPDDQLKLVSALKVLERGVNRIWQKEGHKNTIIYTPPESSEYALAYVLFKDGNADRRYEFINNAASSALEPEHVKSCLVIAKNIDHDDMPYHYIALFKASDN